MVVSDTPIDWDFERWRRTLESYRIDGVPILDPARAKDRSQIAELMSWRRGLTDPGGRNVQRVIEPCPHVLRRTAGAQIVTDDNMGSEWLHFLGRD
jgi:hypothetical protein